ncbi:YkuS family protein [Planococcus sp. N028]|uniref:YkuS family protein n=1 Tax=Planococcus shixiaomingii TaxID=3058393 RepID=A0ABT8N2H1_9BACL|nr:MULTISPECIES: YkuS family protein [unclassified Planococcus (in: firmicutes)]MDN7242086.1 YkuS family protein [Planococcus sp. N028]WKA54360.1 YkuS family protein [Planococcus sp. N022]
MVKIAVEQPFTSVKDALEKKGYKVDMLDQKSDSVSYDCVVVRDKEDLADFHMNVPLVEAKGRTLYDIVEEVEERLVRSGKISAPAGLEKGGMSPFLKGAATGAVIGAAAGLLLTPKSGKEMQGTVKEKATDTFGQVKGKTSDITSIVKEKAGPVSEKVKGTVDQAKEKAKGPVDNLKAKRQEKKEEKELVKQQKAVMKEAKEEQKAVENEVKQEQKAQKEHEKAEKKAEKEIKKAEKEAKQEKGGIEVVELGDASIEKNDNTGGVIISSKDK